MATTQKISTDTPWFRLDLQDADWTAEDPKDLQRWMEQMLLIRRFEEKILDLHGLGLIHGPAHAAIGQEAYDLWHAERALKKEIAKIPTAKAKAA